MQFMKSLKTDRAAVFGNFMKTKVNLHWLLKITSSLHATCQYHHKYRQHKCRLHVGSAEKVKTIFNEPVGLLARLFTHNCFKATQSFCSTAAGYQNPILPNGILRSPTPDLDLPTDLSLHQMVFGKCDEFKDRLAVEEFLTGRKYTYSQMKEAIVRVSGALYRRGYRRGDILLAFSTNNIDYVVLMVACAATGIWFSAANPAFTAEELARQLHHCCARGIVTEPQLTGVVKQAFKSKDYQSNVKDLMVFGEASGFEPFQNLLDDDGKSFPDVAIDPVKDVLFMPYSSGTTGFPKGVMLSHHNIVANVLQYSATTVTQPDDRCLGLAPLFHMFGMNLNLLPALMTGASVTYLPQYKPDTFLKCMQDKKITFAYLVPPLILFLAKHPMISNYDLTSLKQLLVGSAPLGKNLIAQFMDIHPNMERFIQGYGLTETSPAACIDSTLTFGSVGPALPNTLIKIVDPESQNVVGVEEAGEICVKGPQVMLGYYNNQEETHNMISPEGWMSTAGDIGYFDKNGLMYVQDRIKELIKYKGTQVAPAELEALLLSHPDIQDAAVVGVPDEAAGELPRAFVVLTPGAQISVQQVADFVEGKVAPSSRLRGGVRFVQELPKNPSGKILRRVIKSQYL